MNDPNKVIGVNLSALLSLKAELLRKQNAVNKSQVNKVTTEEHIAKQASLRSKDASARKNKSDLQFKKAEPKKIDKQNDAIIYEHEDSALLEKSKRVLEAKSKFYEQMSRTGGKLNMDDNCLVQFNRKQQEDKPVECTRKRQDSSSASSTSADEENDNSEDDWVEYTDCLGRTRKCLRKDFENVKKRDLELAASMPERLDQSKANWLLKPKNDHESDDDSEKLIGPLPTGSINNDGCSMVSKLDEQRLNWERKELENLEKPDVHYQDVFFDEARQHGVGYYAFSTDEEERKRQQEQLEKLRLKTLEEQKQNAELKAKREEIIAKRVRAAKNRQRARLGLPPLETEEAEKLNDEEKVKETKEERLARKRAEKEKLKQEKLEYERELDRQHHIRPWDREKKTTNVNSSSQDFDKEETETWTYKPERLPMSQEQWNELKRAERNTDFAPPKEDYSIKLKRTNFSSVPANATETSKKHSVAPPTQPICEDVSFVNYQSTKHTKQFRRRNYQSNSNEDAEHNAGISQGAAIPPPADLDCSLPIHGKRFRKDVELEQSIEAGLRFLRNNYDKNTSSTKSSWTAKADY